MIRTGRRTRTILLLGILIIVLWFVGTIGSIVIVGLNDHTEVVDVAVVLGTKVESDGTPSIILKSRLDKAVELYQQGYFPYIIVSGGIGKEGFDEAAVMKQYLVTAGISQEKIIIDNVGNNTRLTAENVKQIMDEHQFESVTVISQYFHIKRVRMAFHKEGIKEVASSHADIEVIRDIYFNALVREFFAYYKYVVM